MRALRGAWRWAWAGLLGLGAACSQTKEYEPAVELPTGFGAASEEGGAALDPAQPWWLSLGDPALNALMERALADNLDIRQGWARLEQAGALAEQAGAPWWPQVSADVGWSRRHTIQPIPKVIPPTPENPAPSFTTELAGVDVDTYSAQLSVSYEVDVWGRISALDDAAMHDYRASQEDLQALGMTLSGQVAEAWLGVLEQRGLLDLLQTQDELNAKQLQLLEQRFAHGQATLLDVLQQRQQVEALRGQLPLVHGRLEVLERQLAVLVGVAPGSLGLDARRTLPEPAALPSAGVPSSLLERRPDLRAARHRVEAADRRAAAAFADRLPALRLTGSTGFQSVELEQLFDNLIWNLAANLTAPLWDGGRRAAEQERQEAIVKERLLGWSQLLLVAIREVEDALGNERRQREVLDQLEQQLSLSRMTLRQAEEQYVLGQTNYLTVLVALRNLQQLEQQKISAQRQWLSHRVLLCRALGGSWALPEPKEPQDPQASAPAAREPSAATLVSAQQEKEGAR